MTTDEWPEHEKLKQIPDWVRHKVGDWFEMSGYAVCEWDEVIDEYRPVRMSTPQLLADVFDIDYQALMDEKEEMFKIIRGGQHE